MAVVAAAVGSSSRSSGLRRASRQLAMAVSRAMLLVVLPLLPMARDGVVVGAAIGAGGEAAAEAAGRAVVGAVVRPID